MPSKFKNLSFKKACRSDPTYFTAYGGVAGRVGYTTSQMLIVVVTRSGRYIGKTSGGVRHVRDTPVPNP